MGAKIRVFVHDDGVCSNGQKNTVLVDGYCPVCCIYPDTQSKAIMFVVNTPEDREIELQKELEDHKAKILELQKRIDDIVCSDNV